MSEDRALVVQRMYEAANRRDFALARELLHPHAELHQSGLGVAPDAGASYGREQWERDFARWLSEWEEPRFDPQEVTEADDCVIMRVRVSGRGKTSGIETAMDLFHGWTFRDGKPHRCFVRSTREEILRAVGLEA